MGKQRERYNGSLDVLHGRAVVTPLPDGDAEREFHRNMMRVADAQERKAAMLADPDVPLLSAYEREMEGIADAYRTRLRSVVGDDYESVALAYARGERDDDAGAIAAYYTEAIWRMQQRITVSDVLFFPIILRYPDCFTVNVRFASGHRTTRSVLYESPEHLTEGLEAKHAATYVEESLYTQREAAKLIGDTAGIIREEFPDPDEAPFEERKYGGIVTAGGRKETVFSSMLERVEPDPDRFAAAPTRPGLVEAGPEAARTERELLPEGAFVL
ncbi:hypothetical protein [Halogeometricum luteum]|uniref:Uncharacterized protein n=1 Tax=Halogeometricum luteum TaxID=2950537 RepID=A0ABU2G041_9EURY|nr:hypothetical protein [Halogeometricum sp. S3BR5-2]MDS0294162.1 hypothetical protein [Halogeometricum sp. S3BR5-2]